MEKSEKGKKLVSSVRRLSQKLKRNSIAGDGGERGADGQEEWAIWPQEAKKNYACIWTSAAEVGSTLFPS
jgi:hypothetical protein